MIQSLLLNPITSRILTYAVIALSGFVAGYGLSSRLHNASMSRLEAQHQADLRMISERALEAEERVRALETRMRALVDKARMELEDANRKIQQQETALASLRRDRDILRNGLRNALAAYAAGSSSGDTLAACQSRAGALAAVAADGADLLTEGAGLLEQAALAHDRRAAEVRALLSAWPP